jgi:hypothetical protein
MLAGLRSRVHVRPTVEGTLRLENAAVGPQRVALLLEDAVPVVPAKAP